MPVGHFFGEAHQGIDILHLVHVTAIGDAFPNLLQLVRGLSQRFVHRRLLGHACLLHLNPRDEQRSGPKTFYGKSRHSIHPFLIRAMKSAPSVAQGRAAQRLAVGGDRWA
ncbi:hypothetical protein MES5069_830006 [Mesorhizobium escarrei]|uniref:Uncharacterized protein n=1 Tax=Mesorhizobium escarrei TaxID=666018 RepID=A0ABM9EIY8_9HYPH|nr:hypothetical protein MES5069_830006 [Mesorhizobium escarrei]